MAKSDLKFEYFIREVLERGIHGTVIIDTPEKEADILKCIKILDDHAR
jgi:tryptophan synthase alpha subunit